MKRNKLDISISNHLQFLPIGPFHGISERERAADAALMLSTSGLWTPSTANKLQTSWKYIIIKVVKLHNLIIANNTYSPLTTFNGLIVCMFDFSKVVMQNIEINENNIIILVWYKWYQIHLSLEFVSFRKQWTHWSVCK